MGIRIREVRVVVPIDRRNSPVNVFWMPDRDGPVIAGRFRLKFNFRLRVAIAMTVLSAVASFPETALLAVGFPACRDDGKQETRRPPGTLRPV
ncbi:hypothetical protein [Streptomyces sp. NPDC020377]|uniref:hypothetical protein n=1 Tax=Streptomyces sp. NPDC020377 TaxID=3365070 RepID=UPI00379C88AB